MLWKILYKTLTIYMNYNQSILQHLINKTIHQTDPVGSCATFANEEKVLFTAFNIPHETLITDWDNHCELQVVEHMVKYNRPFDLYITMEPCDKCRKKLNYYAGKGVINKIYTTKIYSKRVTDTLLIKIEQLDINIDKYMERLSGEIMFHFLAVAN